MGRQDVNLEFNTFVGGILTEANPINYPKGYTLDEENFVLQRNGTRRRRRGLDFVGGDDAARATLSFKTIPYIFTHPQGAYVWRNTNRDVNSTHDITQNIDMLVTWSNVTMETFELATNDDIIGQSMGTITFTNPITSVTQWNKYLLVAYGTSYDARVAIYDATSSAVTKVGEVELLARDFPGYQVSTFDVTDRPAVLGTIFEYNLLNQGWNDTNITQFDADIGNFPALADNMNSGLDAATGVFTSTWVELANPGDMKQGGGSAKVNPLYPSKGRAAFYNAETGGAQPDDAFGSAYLGAIQSMAPFAGRVFYLMSTSGSPFGETVLMFSPTSTDVLDIGNCYQSNDPTSRDFNQLLATDGGAIDASIIGVPLKLVALKNRLIIFGSLGVFELYGSNGALTPTNLFINKITDVSASYYIDEINNTGAPDSNIAFCNSPTVVEENVFYMSSGGIYGLVPSGNGLEYASINLTENSIQSITNDIANNAKAFANGIYVPSDKTFRICYNGNTSGTWIDGRPMFKDTELVYDTVLKAWYKNTFYSDNRATIIQPLLIHTIDANSADYPVSDNVRYLCQPEPGSNAIPIHIGRYAETSSFEDWPSNTYTGTVEDAPAYLQTGYISLGDSQRFKQADYIIPSFIRTEDGFTDDGSGNLTANNESSCLMSAYWDYADHDNSGKIGTQFEAYRLTRPYIPSGAGDAFDYGQSVITTKNRVSGRGRALSLRFESSAGKDCQLLGWGLGMEINQRV
jgi:hypothetical protein